MLRFYQTVEVRYRKNPGSAIGTLTILGPHKSKKVRWDPRKDDEIEIVKDFLSEINEEYNRTYRILGLTSCGSYLLKEGRK